MSTEFHPSRTRRAVTVSGIVQGVGFRPFVHGLASRLALAGFIQNRTDGVLIEVEGEVSSLDRFVRELTSEAPTLSRIDDVRSAPRPPKGETGFRIAESEVERGEAATATLISPDVATCEACLSELYDPKNRRFHYPFSNCTNCGPRFTIVCGTPYDRAATTMAPFAMCDACLAEYEDVSDRRFHAQPTACSVCGPRLAVLDANGERVAGVDPLKYFSAALEAGGIGALKGLGGYHLTCDARRDSTVAELRRRKGRDEKPFALLVASLSGVEELCVVSGEERSLLTSPARPIVLLRKRDAAGVAEAVAPGSHRLGVMLPYTPAHHLLSRAVRGAPLVLTSGNLSDEPIAYDDLDARNRLRGIADIFLVHDRPIHTPCDDTVVQSIDGSPSFVRRSRGYAPASLALPVALACRTLAVGGQSKSTFALGEGQSAIVSHHLGDLDCLEANRAYVAAVAHYEELFRIKPRLIVHDLHPDYASTRYAIERAERDGCQLLGVQHHHAHMASCMAEHGVEDAVIGVSFDGSGFGTDGALWGGEFLVGDYRHVMRAAHLAYVGMPGGERAIREPWRMAVAHLVSRGRSALALPTLAGVDAHSVRVVERMLERGLNCPLTSSVGRLFDAVAALVGLGARTTFEGQAAMRLETLAVGCVPDREYPFAFRRNGETIVVDPGPMIEAVARDVGRGVSAAVVARRFHSTVAGMTVAVCSKLRDRFGLSTVALSGGVFMNAILATEVTDRLVANGFRPLRHSLVPPNDGGLSFGQLAIAARTPGTGGG